MPLQHHAETHRFCLTSRWPGISGFGADFAVEPELPYALTIKMAHWLHSDGTAASFAESGVRQIKST